MAQRSPKAETTMSSGGELSLYMELQAGLDNKAMDKIVHKYAPLVKRIAHHLLARMPASVQPDDLIQSGMIGLIEAAKKYDQSKGASFETYAGIRIRGSMLDEIRKGDWAPRSVHRNSRRITEAVRVIESRTGRDAQDREVASELDMDLDRYYAVLHDGLSSRLFSFDEILGAEDGGEAVTGAHSGPALGIENVAFAQALTDAIKALPEREQLVLSLYYDEELNLKEIGEVIGVSESRVSQIHSQAAARLKARLTDWNKQ